MTSARTRRPTIGLLLNSLFDGFEETIWTSVVDAAEEFDANLLCFLGGAQGARSPSIGIVDLIDRRNLDGLVVVSGSVGWISGTEHVAERIHREIGIPTVSLSERAGAVPTLLVDNGAGIAAVVEHLVHEHGRRRIAFVGGPPANSDAVARREAYERTLGRLGLAFDPRLVLEGDFGRDSGFRAARALVSAGVAFDALLGANDAMALAAMEELVRSGRSIPGEVAVAGFDDIIDAPSSGLTTVRQPLREMAREAMRTVLGLVEGERVPPEVTFPARIVVRRSCGCGSAVSSSWFPAPSAPAGGSEPLAAELERRFPDLGARLGHPGWAAELDAAAVVNGPITPEHPFLATLDVLLARGLPHVPDPADWFQVVRVALARTCRTGGTLAEHAVHLSEAALALVGSRTAALEMQRRVRTDEEIRVFRRLVYPIPTPEEGFTRNLATGLPVLGMRSFFLSRLLGPEQEDARLIIHFDLNGAVELEGDPRRFPAWQLVPGRFAPHRRRAHAVLPIHSPTELIGFAICDIGPMGTSGYELLMHQISTVLSVNGLMAEVRDQNRRLLETARQAGMAEVAVGALHNVGNLLNSVSVSAEEIRSAAAAAVASGFARASALLSEHAADLPGFFARDPRSALLPDYFAKTSAVLSQELDRVQAEATELLDRTSLIRESIRALQDHARAGQDQLLRERFDLSDLVLAAIEIQRPHLERHRVQVRQELGELPAVVAPRSKLVHVLVNLVKNAVEAMASIPEDARRLTLRATREHDGGIRFDVTDAGEGIAPENIPRIFSYGFTTKKDGHGFGLHTCANYMKQLGGSIEVHSDGRGTGTTFTLRLPAGR
jgi:DNA-binding LacI/PurR family transcriptional regulator/signal transduction histidine kinase